ncbi:MAG: response regulator [Anaerolineae bacterium]|nr:response regulator [Anaerolineae bacterium]
MSEEIKLSRILVVDDKIHNVKLLNSILSSKGYDVLTADNGKLALEIAYDVLPDLVILDVLMPGMDGFQVAEALRANPDTRPIPILMLTALRELGDKVRGLEAGADDFLSKPFNTVELLARVRSLLRIKTLHDELEMKNALLERVLTHYVSKEIAREVMSNPDKNLQLGGTSSVVSVLFADIRGFTSFSERHEASQVTEALNCIFDDLAPVVFAHNGTLDKYLGDAIMAFYGAPIPSSDNAVQAIQTACEMRNRFIELRERTPLLKELGMGIGVCTGEAVVGNVGSSQMMNYTVIGNTPNTAKRLQENAKAGQILIDEQTYETCKGEIEAVAVSPLALKGRSGLITAYEVVSVKGV